MKKLLLTLLLLIDIIYAGNIYNTFPTDKEALAFKKGFQLALMVIKSGREFEIQGTNNEEIEFQDFIVFVDSTELDTADKIAVQVTGFTYAQSVRLLDDRIAIADFDNRPDAITLAKTLNTTYFNKNAPHRRAYVYEKKKNDRFYRANSITTAISKSLKQQIKDEMKIIYIKDKDVTKIKTPSPTPIVIDKPIIKDIKIQEQPKPKVQTPKKVIKDVAKKVIKPFESHLNKEPFFIQFLNKGKYVTRYKLDKNLNSTNIHSRDFIKQSQIENDGVLIMSDNYIITTDKKKYYKGENGYFYPSNNCEIINDFTKE